MGQCGSCGIGPVVDWVWGIGIKEWVVGLMGCLQLGIELNVG